MAHPIIPIDTSDSEPEVYNTSSSPTSVISGIPSEDEEPEEIPDSESTEEHEIPTPEAPVEEIAPEIPRAAPIFHFGGPRIIHTPRKQVRMPRPRSPTTETSEHVPKRQRAEARRWNWMPDTLHRWATEEGIPSTFEVGGTSRAPPLTGEPAERTIPTLVARSATHERRICTCIADIEDVQEKVEEIENVTGRVQALEEVRHLDDQALGSMHERIRQLEQRVGNLSTQLDSAEHWTMVANQRALDAQERAETAEERAQSAMALAVICLAITSAAVQISAISRFPR